MSHYQEVCQYGFVHGQCRCPDPNKSTRKVDCTNPDSHAAKYYQEHKDDPEEWGEPVRPPAKPELVNHPQHYNSSASGVECIEVIRQMNLSVGNAVKYLWRLGHKDDSLLELKKAQWYLRDQLALDEERGVRQFIQDYPEWVQKFVAHIETVPDGHVRACLAHISNYHNQDPYIQGYDKIRILRYAVHEIDAAVLDADPDYHIKEANRRYEEETKPLLARVVAGV